jgi:hypothetical protein
MTTLGHPTMHTWEQGQRGIHTNQGRAMQTADINARAVLGKVANHIREKKAMDSGHGAAHLVVRLSQHGEEKAGDVTCGREGA